MVVSRSKAKRLGKPPGYFTERPVFPAIVRLRSIKGAFDACAQTLEVALRHTQQLSARHPRGFQGFVDERSKAENLSSRSPPASAVQSFLHTYLVVQVHASADAFFRELNREYRHYKGIDDSSWKRSERADDQVLDPLNQLALNLGNGAGKKLREVHEFGILDYYRQVRNKVAHGAFRSTRVDRDPAKYREYANRAYPGVAAPNEPEQLSYDDFRLYARALQCFSEVLNDLCELTPEDVARHVLNHTELVARTLPLKGQPKKMKRVLASYFHSTFGQPPSSFADEFADLALPTIMGIPNRRARQESKALPDARFDTWLGKLRA
jgi:hypothetical protein